MSTQIPTRNLAVDSPFQSMSTQVSNRNFAGDLPFQFPDPSVLDAMDLRQLLQLTRESFAQIKRTKRIQEGTEQVVENLGKLDNVYTIKVARRLAESHVTADTRELTAHFQAIAGDQFWRDTMDADLRRFRNRWETMADILQASLRIADYASAIAKRHVQNDSAPAAWYWVANEVRSCGERGIGWSALLERANSAPASFAVNPMGKSKFSGIVATMRLANWLRIVPHGRQKTLHLSYAAQTDRVSSGMSTYDDSRLNSDGRTTDLRISRDVVCGLSGAFISYLMLGSDKHKRLRSSYVSALAPNSRSLPQQRAALKAVETTAADLYGFLSAQTIAVAHASFAYLDQYFDRAPRKGKFESPRISVKIVESNPSSAGMWVLDLARNHRPTGNEPRVESSVNTGFRQVESTGRSFLLNDVPRAVFEGRYENPRLRKDLVNEFCASEAFRSGEDLTPFQWRNLWKGAEKPDGFSSAYKSTLIIPITLRNNHADPEFVQLLADMTKSTCNTRQKKPLEMDRAILGFLCFDHSDVNYFQQADEDIGYVVADWLSLFLMVRYAYTTLSTTFASATSLLEKQNDVRPDNLIKTIVNQRSSTSNKARTSVGAWASPTPPRPDCHQPVGLDRFDVEVREGIAA